VHVWPGPDCRGALYLDAGEGFGHREGALRRVHYACKPSGKGISVTAASTGPYPTWWTATTLVVHGVPRAPTDARTGGGGALAVQYDPALGAARVSLPGAGAEFPVRMRW